MPAVIAGIVGQALQPRHATLTPFRGEEGVELDQGVAIFYTAPH